MIFLHQYPAIWGLPSLSPFCIKVEVFLRQANLPYKIVIEKNPARGPKGKMPFITHGDRVIADSSFILDYLIRTFGLEQFSLPVAEGVAFQRMIEEFLYFSLLYSRWIDPRGWAVVQRDFSPLFPTGIGGVFLPFLPGFLC